MASQDGEEKVVKYPAGDKKLDTKNDSKSPLENSTNSVASCFLINARHPHLHLQLPTCSRR